MTSCTYGTVKTHADIIMKDLLGIPLVAVLYMFPSDKSLMLSTYVIKIKMC